MGRGVRFFVVVFAFKSLADEYSGEVGEDERLQEGHQYFNEINKDGKCQREWCCTPACSCIHVTKYEYQ